ncbi:Phospholipid scramblase 2 [Holothuria leucospilota]|uniref:Phospholipid scramblase n=1 Tax=Holothuria leucospilota TaxID=206669 RepID=A0A9Q1CP81_HOLLE|nr:Phospholipid scramblase 2 [Holothuria leucospilota]
MDEKQQEQQTQYGMAGNVVTVPPAPGPPPGQALPGQVQIQWMAPPPQSILGCPPGMEYLTQLDQLLVHQQVELFEAFTGIDTKNRYQIKNALGQQVNSFDKVIIFSTRLVLHFCKECYR